MLKEENEIKQKARTQTAGKESVILDGNYNLHPISSRCPETEANPQRQKPAPYTMAAITSPIASAPLPPPSIRGFVV